jgi:hypothetical protein
VPRTRTTRAVGWGKAAGGGPAAVDIVPADYVQALARGVRRRATRGKREPAAGRGAPDEGKGREGRLFSGRAERSGASRTLARSRGGAADERQRVGHDGVGGRRDDAADGPRVGGRRAGGGVGSCPQPLSMPAMPPPANSLIPNDYYSGGTYSWGSCPQPLSMPAMPPPANSLIPNDYYSGGTYSILSPAALDARYATSS